MLNLTRLFAKKVQVSGVFSNSKGFFGTSSSFNAAAQLPSNLQLADASVIKALPESNFPVLNYSFAALNVPTSIEVKKFLVPGEHSASLPLERRIFEVAIRRDIVHNVIRYIRHKKRQPKKTKRVNEISGSKKKPRPQKGTGQSQVGNKRNSVWRGGQKAFGPVLRDYSIQLNRKVRALGMMMTLAAKFREGNLIVFDSFTPASPRTKDLHALLEAHGIKECSALFVERDDCMDEQFVLASRNLKYAAVKERRQSSVYEILKKDKLVFSSAAFMDVQQRLMNQYLYSGKRKTMMESLQILAEAKTLTEKYQQQQN